MRVERLREIIFFLLVIFLPTQLGLHFWPEWAFINGVRIDYFSPTIYLTDILVLGLFILEVPGIKFKIRSFQSKAKGLLILLALLVFLNVYFSLSPAVSIYKWVKVWEFGFLIWWLSRRISSSWQFYLPTLLLVSVFYESVLAVWQFAAQSSIGGFWYLLGERTFNSGTPGIANAYINGELVMRPYGTFSHPNVLGGFLAVFLPVILVRFLHNSRKISAPGKWITLGILGLGYLVLFLSMSRVAILVGMAMSFAVLWRKFKMVALGMLGALVILGIIMWPRFSAIVSETEPFLVRQQLNRLALEQFTHSPIWGRGLGTAVSYQALGIRRPESNYALAFQPTHNVYLLLLAETGLVGLELFVFVVIKIFGATGIVGRSTLLVILFLGVFDHYFLTLQQGQLILALIMGLSLGLGKRREFCYPDKE